MRFCCQRIIIIIIIIIAGRLDPKLGSRIGDRRSAYGIFVGKHGEWRSHGRPSCMWENNIKMYVIEFGWQSVELGSSGSG